MIDCVGRAAPVGALRSLVAHQHGVLRVVSSNLTAPTIFPRLVGN